MSANKTKRILCIIFALTCLMMLTVTPSTAAETAKVVGDSDGSGAVNSDDVVYLLYHTLYPSDYILHADCDVNGDGKLDNDDVIYLMYNTVFGEAEYPLGSAALGKLTGLTVNGVDISNFTLVRPHYNSSYLTQIEMEAMTEDIYSSTGCRLSIVEDAYVTEGDYEIVVGNADRKGVKKVTSPDTFTITVSGNKVYLNGDSPHSTAMAVSEFYKMLKSGNVTNAQSVTGSYTAAIENYDSSKRYTPKWSEDFSSETIDTDKWTVYSGNNFAREGQNGMWTAMTDDPDYVFNKDGNFYILGHATADTYYGGTITTEKSMTFQYGYAEKSCIVPDGNSFWSLMWFSGTSDGTGVNYRPEIDLNECFGDAAVTAANCHKWPTAAGKEAGYTHASLDGKSQYNARRYRCPDNAKLSDTYHTYGFLWTDTEMAFIADGKVFFTYDITQTPEDIDAFVNSYMHIKLSYSVGRANNSQDVTKVTDYEWTNTNRFVVDYLYLYRLDDGKGGIIFK